MFDQLDKGDSRDTISSLLAGLIIIVICVGIPIGICVLLGAGSVDPNAKHILEDQGYTHVKITGGRYSGCNGGSFTITGFQAESPNTHRVITGQVCSTMAGTHYIEVD